MDVGKAGERKNKVGARSKLPLGHGMGAKHGDAAVVRIPTTNR